MAQSRLEWVEAQNAKASAVLQADPDYQKDYEAILQGAGCHGPHPVRHARA